MVRRLTLLGKGRRWPVVGGLLALLFIAPPSASGDWLLTTDGQEIETDGPWQIKGQRVIFTDPKGTLSSLRLSEVDLGGSKQLTGQRGGGAVRSGVTVLDNTVSQKAPALFPTDEDVGHVNAAEMGVATQAQRPQPGTDVRVILWEQVEEKENTGVQITGKLRSFGKAAASDLKLLVLLHSGEEGLVGRSEARIESTSLGPGEVSSFEAAFPGVLEFDRAEFRVQSTTSGTKASTDSSKAPKESSTAETPSKSLPDRDR